YKINKLSYYLERFSYGSRTHLIAVSNEVLADFDKWIGIKGPAYVVYNMIDERFADVQFSVRKTGGSLKLVAVGNLRWQKNYEYLLEAFRHLPVNVSVDIYGEGTLRNSLQAVIDQYSLPVRLMGHHSNLESILPNYDAMVMCS